MSKHQQQTEALLAALKAGPMTAAQIWHQLGIARASARVFDLRQDGYDVRSQMITVRNRHGDGCRVAQYSLASQQRTLLPRHPGRGCVSERAAAA